MSDQAFLLDEVARFGDPWHGLFRGGVLELPNATTRALAVMPDAGDCFEIKVPDTPAVMTDSIDAAAGMTWLNYGLIAGRRHVFYQKSLGELSWIYTASDRSTWVATVAWSGINAGSLTLRPLFDGVPTQTIALAMSPAISYQASIAGAGRVMDIRQDGAAVVFAHLINTQGSPYTDWNIRAISRLDISGIPPAATAGLSLVNEIDHPVLNGVTVTDTVAYSRTWRMEWVDSSTDPPTQGYVDEVIVGGNDPINEFQYPYPAPQGEWYQAWYYTQSASGLFSRDDTIGYVFANNGALTPVKFRQQALQAGAGWADPDPYNPGTGRVYSGGRTDKQQIVIGSHVSATVEQVYSWSGTNSVANQDSGFQAAWFWRYSNRFYGLTEGRGAITRHYAPVSPAGVGAEDPIDGTEKPFASWHPISGQRVFSPSSGGVVCWV